MCLFYMCLFVVCLFVCAILLFVCLCCIVVDVALFIDCLLCFRGGLEIAGRQRGLVAQEEHPQASAELLG